MHQLLGLLQGFEPLPAQQATQIPASSSVPIPKPLDPLLVAGPDNAGYGTIGSLTISLIAATVFSEAMWQKVCRPFYAAVPRVIRKIGKLLLRMPM
jgi:hypothetical protein